MEVSPVELQSNPVDKNPLEYLILRRKPFIRLGLREKSMKKLKSLIPEGYSLKIVKNMVLTEEQREQRRQQMLKNRLTPRRGLLLRVQKINSKNSEKIF